MRFIGDGDLTYKNPPEVSKNANTAREIVGQIAQIKLMCGEYPIGENLLRTRTTKDDNCRICKHYYGKEIAENVEHLLYRCPKLQEDDKVQAAERELRSTYSELLEHTKDFGGKHTYLVIKSMSHLFNTNTLFVIL